METRLMHPFTAIVAGSTKSGKTEFCKKLIYNIEHMVYPVPQQILWCYAEYQPAYQELSTVPNLQFIEGLPDLNELKETKHISKIMFIDDLMAECGKGSENDQLNKLFTRGSHHWNISIVHIVQNLFHTNLRCARINAHYIVLMRNPTDQLQAMTYAKQVFPGKSKYFQESLQDACSKKYGYLLIDVSPESSAEIRLRTNIFPDEICYCYVPKV